MAYTAVPATDAIRLNQEYKDQVTKIKTETRGGHKRLLEEELTRIGNRARDELNKDIATVKNHHQQHQATFKESLATATKEFAYAKKIAAAYKAHPTKTEYPPQLKFQIKKLTDLEDKMRDDSHDYGLSWSGYRANVGKDLPAALRANFETTRNIIINADKLDRIKLQKVVSMKQEATALLAIVEKATLKADIKRDGTGAERKPQEALRLATAIATELEQMLNDLRNPPGRTPSPSSLKTSSERLVNSSTEKDFVTKPNALTGARGFWENVEVAFKLMQTKTANMEKVLATRVRGMRSTELQISAVKAQVAKAKQRVVEAKADVKASAIHYAAGKKAMATIEAQAKKRGIR